MFADIGDVIPKGFEDPVRLFEVRWREEGWWSRAFRTPRRLTG